MDIQEAFNKERSDFCTGISQLCCAQIAQYNLLDMSREGYSAVPHPQSTATREEEVISAVQKSNAHHVDSAATASGSKDGASNDIKAPCPITSERALLEMGQSDSQQSLIALKAALGTRVHKPLRYSVLDAPAYILQTLCLCSPASSMRCISYGTRYKLCPPLFVLGMRLSCVGLHELGPLQPCQSP